MREPFNVWHDIYIIGGAEISHPYDCCVYLIDAGDLVLIDSGAGESFDQLIDNIRVLKLNPEKLGAVIVTHAHIDHIGALARLKQKYGVKIIAHEVEAKAIQSGNRVGAEFYGVDYAPCQVDLKLKETQQKLHVGKYEFNALHIPGHTAGSIAVYMDTAGKRVLFGQDVHGPYEVAWGGDPKQAVDSLQKLIDVKADVLCEGHFGIFQPASAIREYLEHYLGQLQVME